MCVAALKLFALQSLEKNTKTEFVGILASQGHAALVKLILVLPIQKYVRCMHYANLF
jgi:hypothetical protein